MEIVENNNTVEIIYRNDEDSFFKIHYVGGDLYWTMFNYSNNNNSFNVNKKDEIFFLEIENLFNIIEKNNFEWISEAYGLLEDNNKLIITKNGDQFVIKFQQNPNNKFNTNKNMCAICFCLSGSRNRDIANFFSMMYYNCIEKGKTKILK